PRIDPDPAAVGVRRPAGVDPRPPHRTVVARALPLAVVVEIGGAVDVLAHVLRADRVLDAPGALRLPLVPAVAARRGVDARARRVADAVDRDAATVTDLVLLAGDECRDLAGVHLEVGVAVARDGDAVGTRLAHHERAARGVDLDVTSVRSASHAIGREA